MRTLPFKAIIAKTDRKSLNLANKAAQEAKKYSDSLKEMNSYNDVISAPYPLDLALTIVELLNKSILDSFKEGRTSPQPSTRKGKQLLNSLLATSRWLLANDLLPKIEFSYDLVNTEALNAFRDSSVVVAHVLTTEAQEAIRFEANKAIELGIPFNTFRDKIKMAGLEPENPYHLRTNFQTAMSSAYEAGKWKTIQDLKDLFPGLKYVAIMDDRVRDEHAALNGLVFPVDDPFWSRNYPPNGWNCRCDVEMMTEDEFKSQYNPDQFVPDVPVDSNFQKNVGETNDIWGNYTDGKAEKVSQTYKEAGRPEWDDVPKNKAENRFNVDNMSKEEILNFAKDYLNDRQVFDCSGKTVILKKDSVNKFEETNLSDLKKRISYLGQIEDVLLNPYEAWYSNKDGKFRNRYLKKYENGVIVICEMSGTVLEYFNIIISDKPNYMANQREGLLFYKQE